MGGAAAAKGVHSLPRPGAQLEALTLLLEADLAK